MGIETEKKSYTVRPVGPENSRTLIALHLR
jgi:hypothetical protein